MGLDIAAYSHLQYLCPEDEDYDVHSEHNHVHLYEIGFGRLVGQQPGWYTPTAQTESIQFRAGSYSGYNHWREALCQQVHGVTPAELWHDPEAYTGKQLVELINFSDCEGTIGALVSAKLRDDCAYWLQVPKVPQWCRAFTLAAQQGAVCFY